MLFSCSAQVCLKSVHPGFPRRLSRQHPLHRVVERVSLQPARPPLSLPAAHDQPRVLEHFEVARNRRKTHRERLRQLVHGRLALGESGHDRTACRISKGSEGDAELVSWHLTLPLINTLIKCRLPAEGNRGTSV